MGSPMLATHGAEHKLGDWHPARRPDTDTHEVVKGLGKHSDLSEPETASENAYEDHKDIPNPMMAPELSSTSTGPTQTYLEQSKREQSPTDSQRESPETAKIQNHAAVGNVSGLRQGEQQPRQLQHELPIGDAASSAHDEQLNGFDAEVLPDMAQNETIFEEQGAEKQNSDTAASEWFGNSHYPARTTWDEVAGNEDFAVLSTYNRTNSFPDVLPVKQSSLPANALPKSQAENIIEENEDDIRSSNQDDLGIFSPTEPSLYVPKDPFAEELSNRDDGGFDNDRPLQGGDMPTPRDEDARYEEGLPLVPLKSDELPSEPDLQNVSEGDSAVPPVPDTAEDDFFTKTPKISTEDEMTSRPQPLDRKNTNQVLGSMTYPPHSETHDEATSTRGRPSLDKLTGGGIAVSSTTVISQVLGEQQANKLEQAKDEDLAAMWQAALDDDELLDEEAAEDSSPLFEDDGKGFLEDELDKDGQISSPLQPVYSPDGRMQGFAHAGTAQNHAVSTQSKYTPNSIMSSQGQPSNMNNSYQTFTGHSQSSSQTLNGISNPVSTVAGLQRPQSQQQPTYGKASPLSRPQLQSSAQSFADKPKASYESPYDFPMDVSRPKKRNYTQQLRPGSGSAATTNRPPPPPRSSSMFTSGNPVVDSHPPLPIMPNKASLPPVGNSSGSLKPKSSTGSFFEELPSVKPRLSSSNMRPPAPHPPSQPQTPSQQQPLRHQSLQSQPSSGPSADYGLVPPQRMNAYDDVPSQGQGGSIMPSIASRYSPAPKSQTHVPPPKTRYAVSPSSGSRVPPPQSLPFQPRTSSPLAVSGMKNQQEGQAPGNAQHQGQSTGVTQSAHGLANTQEQNQLGRSSPPPVISRYAPGSGSSTSSHAISTPPSDQMPLSSFSSGSQTQDQQYSTSGHMDFAPPRRSQTQSPNAVRSKPSLPIISRDIYQRPASVNDQPIPQQSMMPPSVPVHQSPGRSRAFSQNIDYIRPSDGRETDPLERWKGCPIFRFGFGGTSVSSFPKLVPRYAAGRNKPSIKCSQGEVKVSSAKALSFDANFTTFPGPLRSKSKKKEVLEWLQQRIDQLERTYRETAPASILSDPQKRQKEKILLWRLMYVLVEYDGAIEGKAAAEKAVRLVLSPETAEGSTDILSPSSNTEIMGISKTHSAGRSEPTDLHDVETLRTILIQGEREKAVWHALDKRLWAHAMLISSTMDKTIWKQVLQEFIRQEVKTSGQNTESLAALYQIFAGNWEESIDELVPPSARAGLQFVSKAAGPGSARNALDGLDRWRETLTLTLSNRSQGDSQALVALGRLMSSYGRIEAAHSCFIFAKVPGLFGGADDPSTCVTLLGAGHVQGASSLGLDTDAILLTEIYDFACSVLASSTSPTVSPYLQPYKLYHAMLLAENSCRSEALQYCDTITAALKSITKLPPYYHNLLFAALDDLVGRLRQAPNENTSSWMSKPSLDRVSGSFFSRVNQFIAGDDSDADSAASGKGTDPAAGPFAGVSGDTPGISRASSSADLYGSYAPAQPPPAATAAGSRYAPAGQYAPQGLYTPRSSLEQPERTPRDHQHPSTIDSLRPPYLNQQYPLSLSRSVSTGNFDQHPTESQTQTSYQPSPYPPYAPSPLSQSKYISETTREDLSTSPYHQPTNQPTPPPEPQSSQNPYQPNQALEVGKDDYGLQMGSYQKSSSSYEPPRSSEYAPSIQQITTSAYEPPTTNGYEPPSHVSDSGVNPIEDEPQTEEKPKKKSFMDDDDDDFTARAAAVLKAQRDREADDAFKKAAEADGLSYFETCVHFKLTNALIAKKGPELKSKKSGWFAGWLGGGKKDDLSTQNASAGPIKAKLGEESSFYYDKELKKWVNKKSGDTPAAAAATPPPPKGPPSRAVSSSGAPPVRKDTDTPPVPPLPSTATPPISMTGPSAAAPQATSSPYASGLASRSASPAVQQGEQPVSSAGLGVANAGASGANPPPAPPSAPPSRPATGASNDTIIDDLIGVPQARKGGTIKKAKKGRGYIDVMANKT